MRMKNPDRAPSVAAEDQKLGDTEEGSILRET
jgi:hypothetical protein